MVAVMTTPNIAAMILPGNSKSVKTLKATAIAHIIQAAIAVYVKNLLFSIKELFFWCHKNKLPIMTVESLLVTKFYLAARVLIFFPQASYVSRYEPFLTMN